MTIINVNSQFFGKKKKEEYVDEIACGPPYYSKIIFLEQIKIHVG